MFFRTLFIYFNTHFLLLISVAGLINIGYSASLPKTCTSECTQPFGAKLGQNSHVSAYSNCNTDCISQNTSTAIDNAYTGMSWQCVEYARRWLIQGQHVTFADVDNAQHIWHINEVSGISDNKKYTFISMPNANSQPPAIGDLIIYKIALPDFPYGHVAVIVNVNLKAGYVDIAEQNYTNDHWIDANQFARRIILTHQQGKYRVVDKDYGNLPAVSGNGTIMGWKRALK